MRYRTVRLGTASSSRIRYCDMLRTSESARTSRVTCRAYLAIYTAAWPAALPLPTMNISVPAVEQRLRDAGPIADTAADELGHAGVEQPVGHPCQKYGVGAQLGPVEEAQAKRRAGARVGGCHLVDQDELGLEAPRLLVRALGQLESANALWEPGIILDAGARPRLPARRLAFQHDGS